MTSTILTPRAAELSDGRQPRLLDPRRLTAPAPVAPLLVLMGFGGLMQMGGAVFALALLGIRNEYHDGLAMLVALGVQRGQLGLGLDLPLAVVATRTEPRGRGLARHVRLLVLLVVLGLAGVFPNGILLYLSAFAVINGMGALDVDLALDPGRVLPGRGASAGHLRAPDRRGLGDRAGGTASPRSWASSSTGRRPSSSWPPLVWRSGSIARRRPAHGGPDTRARAGGRWRSARRRGGGGAGHPAGGDPGAVLGALGPQHLLLAAVPHGQPPRHPVLRQPHVPGRLPPDATPRSRWPTTSSSRSEPWRSSSASSSCRG